MLLIGVYELMRMIFLNPFVCMARSCLHVYVAVHIITITGSSLVMQLKHVFIKHHVTLLYCSNNLIAHLNVVLYVSLAACLWMKQQRMRRQWMSLFLCQQSPDLIYKSPVTLHSALGHMLTSTWVLCSGCFLLFVLILLEILLEINSYFLGNIKK